MQNISYLDETFDINQASTYFIFIQLVKDGFRYTVFDPVRYKFIVLKSYKIPPDVPQDMYLEEIDKIYNTDSHLNCDFKKAYIVNTSSKSLLVPEIFFSKNKLIDLFTFSNNLDDLDELHYNYISHLKGYNIFTIQNDQANQFVNKYKRVEFLHQATPMVESVLKKQRSHTKQAKVYISLYNGMFDMMVAQNGGLKMYNIFQFKNENDLAYYVLFVYKQLGLEPASNETVINGDINEDTPYYKMLDNFIANIQFQQLDNTFLYSYTFRKVASHHFVNLFNVAHCV